MVRKLKERYERCFSRLKCNKIGATNGITSQAAKKRKNYVFRSKKTTNKVPPNMITGLQVGKKIRLMFWRPEYIMKGKCYVFSGYKERNKVLFLFPECRLQKDRYGSYMFNLKCCKTVETTYLERRKKQIKDGRRFSNLKCLQKGNNCFIGLCQQTNQVKCIYLALKNLKSRGEKVQHWSQSLKESTNDVFVA